MRTWHWLTPDEKRRALEAATADPGRPWRDIARAEGMSPWAVIRFLRRQLGSRRGTPDWRAGKARAQPAKPRPTLASPVHLSCPGCHHALPPIPEGAKYRCRCGRLIAPGQSSEGAA